MKLRDLRAGTYIYYCDEFYKVDYECLVNHLDDEQDDAYKPIPLTEEWLIKFGFDEVWKLDGYANKNHIIYKLRDDNWLFHPFCTTDEDCHIIIKYVHQLQNLHYTLTGEELEYENTLQSN